MRVGRILAVWALALVLPAWALPPQLTLGSVGSELNLGPSLMQHRVPEVQAGDPDALWAHPDTPVTGERLLKVDAGQTLVGRIRLQSDRSRALYMVQLPSSRVDHVQLWWRADGGAWRSAEAGDTVPLARWPFYGQYPAFSIPTHEEAIDLVFTVHNSGPLRLPVWIRSEKSYQEGRLRQANMSGVVIGMGIMVAVVTLISLVTLRTASSWVLLAFALWSVLTVTSVNGYAAIWFLPDIPLVNDGGKHFTAVVLAGLLVWACSVLLDRIGSRALARWLGPVVVLLAVAYGLVQLLWLPGSMRVPGGVGFSLACVVLCAGMCLLSARRGGRYVRFIVAALLCYIGVILLGAEHPDLQYGLDLRAAGAALLLFGATLLFRHAQFSRERYGRDVLGRAAVSANRDPLTALLSFSGLQHAVAHAVLRESAGQGMASMLMFVLPGLERSGEQHGFVLTERALVRFAANLQDLLGRDWSIGRVDKSHFCAISVHELSTDALVELCTRVLTRCLRNAEPPGAVTDFDLRIVCRVRGVADMPFAQQLQQMEAGARALPQGKRIALV